MSLSVFYITETDRLTQNELSLLDACMQCAALEYTEDNDDEFLEKILLSILNGEGCGISEMASIQLSTDSEELEPRLIKNNFSERPYIVFNYDKDYLVIKLNRGIQLIIEWCYKNLKLELNSNLRVLLNKMADKYL